MTATASVDKYGAGLGGANLTTTKTMVEDQHKTPVYSNLSNNKMSSHLGAKTAGTGERGVNFTLSGKENDSVNRVNGGRRRRVELNSLNATDKEAPITFNLNNHNEKMHISSRNSQDDQLSFKKFYD